MTGCEVEGCDRARYAKAWCALHYNRQYRHGDPLADYSRVRPTCSQEGCDKPHRARGLCKNHYYQWRRAAKP